MYIIHLAFFIVGLILFLASLWLKLQYEDTQEYEDKYKKIINDLQISAIVFFAIFLVLIPVRKFILKENN